MEYHLKTPLPQEDIDRLKIYDTVLITGKIYAGRDAVLPKVVKSIEEHSLEEHGIELQGQVVFHTAVSCAGIGPTSSNKLEIEESIRPLSENGVKLHLGKGALKPETVEALKKNGSVFAVTPPVTALFFDNMKSKRVVAFPELGMEALYELDVVDFPAIIAIAQGESIFDGGK